MLNFYNLNILVLNFCLDISEPEEQVIENSVQWLKNQLFGRVSAIKRFRTYLSRHTDAFKLYQFWIDVEHT